MLCVGAMLSESFRSAKLNECKRPESWVRWMRKRALCDQYRGCARESHRERDHAKSRGRAPRQ
jgi:hypothetical protein